MAPKGKVADPFETLAAVMQVTVKTSWKKKELLL
jgi:hypothetical protein